MKAMILAAGLGTRLRPLTNKIPKALINVGGIPMLERVIERLKKAGVSEIVINTHHLAPKIIDFLIANRNFGIKIEISHEEKILDTGGGLKKAASFLAGGEPFFLYNSDILTDFDLEGMKEWHKLKKAAVTLAVMNRKSSRKIIFDREKLLCGWENSASGEIITARPAEEPIKLAFCGVHLISPEIFPFFPGKEVFSMTNFYLELAAREVRISGFPIDGASWFDIGDPEKLEKARKSLE